MPKTSVRVVMLEHSQNPLSLIYAACRQCYAAGYAADMFSQESVDAQKKSEFIAKIVASGHESPLEHVKFTFAIEGVSRALTHQLVRHRVASYSQQSQRYVKETDFDYITPPSIARNPVALAKFEETMRYIQQAYTEIGDALKSDGLKGESVNQDARFVLPQAAETKIVVTMNCRELIHFFKHRCCSRAQWEIRALAQMMAAQCHEVLPEVFPAKAAKCDYLGYCPEGTFCCGRYPVR
jgi:thymidylate synthase (FAD)